MNHDRDSRVPNTPRGDLEKTAGLVNTSSSSSTERAPFKVADDASPIIPLPPLLARWNTKIESLSRLEVRGITRVLPEERDPPSTMATIQMSVFWFSANIMAGNLAVGLLGPLVFNLGFVDSAMCAVFGSFVGSLATAYTSIWGPMSGNRTMIVTRFSFGYWPGKLVCVLNAILMIGWGIISCIVGGQMLSAVSGGSMSIVVGVVVVALISWLVAVFGMRLFHTYERYQWIPQVIVLLILVGRSAPNYNTSLQSIGPPSTITANRLSFFYLIASVPASWAGAGSDFYVYYPPSTRASTTFFMTWIGLTVAFCFVNLIGVGLGAGVVSTPAWATAYNVSSGALILAGFGDLGGFGKFCGVVVALGVTANNIPSTYAAALGCQVLGRYGKAIPRYMWVCLIIILELVCGVAGRNNLFNIFENFLAIMGYWIVSFVSVMLEEHLIFRRLRGVDFDWSRWEDRHHLPVGMAALVAFLAGWAGCLLGMDQLWYVGPIATLVGDGYGGDIGAWLGMGFTLVVFPPLRWLELRKFGR